MEIVCLDITDLIKFPFFCYQIKRYQFDTHTNDFNSHHTKLLLDKLHITNMELSSARKEFQETN